MDEPVKLIRKLIISFMVEPKIGSDYNKLNVHNSQKVVNFHSKELVDNGDVSISSFLQCWISFCKKTDLELRPHVIGYLRNFCDNPPTSDTLSQLFLGAALSWPLPVENVQLHPNNRYCLFFQRNLIKQAVIRAVISSSNINSLPYGYQKKNPDLLAQLESFQLENDNEPQCLTNYRSKLLNDIVGHLLQRSFWTVVDNLNVNLKHKVLRLAVHSSTAKVKDSANVIRIIVGPVLEPKTKKLAIITSTEYKKLRSNDMKLMALHKYGSRVKKQDTQIYKLISRLGSAAATIDLFEVRPSSPVLLIKNGVGSSKGASFVLYNSSRLETLLRSFDQLVSQYALSPLPDLEFVDLDLLKEEDEWQLIFGYVLRYPYLIESSVEHLAKGQCVIHLIVRFINELVAVFSGYYRRSQILIKRPNLMPVVHARLYLIKAVRYVLNDALSILNIEPIQLM